MDKVLFKHSISGKHFFLSEEYIHFYVKHIMLFFNKNVVTMFLGD